MGEKTEFVSEVCDTNPKIIQVLSIAHRHRCQEQMTKILRVRIMQLAHP